MAGGTWKIAVLVALCAIFVILEYHTTEAQASACARCSINARCYSTFNGIYCRCRRGWSGNGLAGPGNSGCRRNRVRTWQVVVSVIGASLGALLILCLCLACIRNCFARRRHRGQQGGDPAQGYPQQAAYPQKQSGYPPQQGAYPPQQGAYPPQQGAYPPQQGVPMYATNHHKVPGPQGVV